MLVRCGIAQSDISQATRRIASSVWATKKQGPAAIEERKLKAEAILQTTVYTGNDGHFTWDDYIRVRQKAHLELALLEAPVDKKRMVALMLDGVQAHGLEPLIGAIRDNRVLLADFDAVQKLLKRSVIERGIDAHQQAATCTDPIMGTEISIDSSSGSGDGKRKRGSHSRGQQIPQPKFAKEDNLDVEIHAGYYPKGVYRSLSEGQQEQVKALRDAKKNNVSYGLKAVVPASVTDVVEPVPDVSTTVKKVVSPDETSPTANAATGSGDSGAPADDKDSVIAAEDNEPARDGVQKVTLVYTPGTEPQTCSGPILAIVPFGCVADKKPAPENSQVVAAVAVDAKPEADVEKKPTPEPRGPRKGWNQFTEGGKPWSLCTQEEKDKAVFKYAEYAHWRENEEGGAEGHCCLLEFGMIQSRYMDHSAYVAANPDPNRDLKAARQLMDKQAYEQIRAWGYPKHR
jgi:hypothetical protein